MPAKADSAQMVCIECDLLVSGSLSGFSFLFPEGCSVRQRTDKEQEDCAKKIPVYSEKRIYRILIAVTAS